MLKTIAHDYICFYENCVELIECTFAFNHAILARQLLECSNSKSDCLTYSMTVVAKGEFSA